MQINFIFETFAYLLILMKEFLSENTKIIQKGGRLKNKGFAPPRRPSTKYIFLKKVSLRKKYSLKWDKKRHHDFVGYFRNL